jgi:hypothetical protein
MRIAWLPVTASTWLAWTSSRHKFQQWVRMGPGAPIVDYGSLGDQVSPRRMGLLSDLKQESYVGFLFSAQHRQQMTALRDDRELLMRPISTRR